MKKTILDLFFFSLSLFFIMVGCSDLEKELLPPKEEPEKTVIAEVENYKSNRILIKHGLQLQCWLASDNFELAAKLEQPAFVMLPSDWAQTGFTAPTFFGPPLINPSFFNNFPDSQWSMAKAPYGDHLKVAPTDFEKKEGFLKEEHKKHLDKLITMCFGDEEHYSEAVLTHLKAWYNVARLHYPDVLLHNNQYPGQWSNSEMSRYVKTAKPDLVTYDWYYFHTSDPLYYKGAKDMTNHLMSYRKLALDGIDGNGKYYIAFGQYIQGFANEGTYRLTESQLRLYYFMTLTFGGKWLNWFRYLQGNGYGGQTQPSDWALLLEKGMPGKPSIYMKWANQCNKECMYLSDYIVRLKTTDVRFVPGTSNLTEGKSGSIKQFDKSVSCIEKVQARLMDGDKETDEGGDLYLGSFDIIPKEEQGDPAFFSNQDARFFMLTNGLASSQKRNAEELTQMITMTIDMSGLKNKTLSWLNMHRGNREELKSVSNDGDKFIYKFPLNGGSGTLLIVE